MENKFTKCVSNHKKQELDATKPETTRETPIPKEKKEENSSLVLSDYMSLETERKAKNKTFYLDGAVIQALKKAATAQHVTESKLVNSILKKILLLDK